MQLLSAVNMCGMPTTAPSVKSALSARAAVQTSYSDRYRLKSSTSREFSPSLNRTLTAFGLLVLLTTEIRVELPALVE